MASTSEQGHARNVAKFNKLIVCCTSYGSKYNPSRPNLKVTALETVHLSAQAMLSAVNSAVADQKNAATGLKVAFKPIDKLVTRIVNGVKATDTSPEIDKQVADVVRKIHGSRASKKKTEDEKKALPASGKEVKEISSSQMSYDSRLENFDKLIKLLLSIPQYKPNETELTTESLITLYNDLKSKNNTYVADGVALAKARAERNLVLYKEVTGMLDLAADVKTYVKSAFGASSPEYKQISKIQFDHP
jgi:hypothetical protein